MSEGNTVDPIFLDEKILEERIPPITRKAWQKLRWAGKGPPYYRRPGSNRIYYKWDEVEEWLTSNRVEPK